MKFSRSQSVILGLVLLSLSVFPWSGRGADLSDLTYTISNNEATITDCNTSASGHLDIPATIEGHPVTSIGDYAFQYCSSLTSITIPDSVTRIGDSVFIENQSMHSITVSSENPNYSSEDGVLFNKTKTVLIAFPGGKSGEYSIPSGVLTLEFQAFDAIPFLSKVFLPATCTIFMEIICHMNSMVTLLSIVASL